MTTVNRGAPTPNMPKGPLFLRYTTDFKREEHPLSS